MSFYEAAAQLMPLLFVTFLVEGYVVARRGERAFEQGISILQYVALIFVFVWGEVITLRVLARGHPNPGDQDSVNSALVVGTALLVIPVLLEFARGLSARAGEIMEWVVSIGAVAAVLLVVLA